MRHHVGRAKLLLALALLMICAGFASVGRASDGDALAAEVRRLFSEFQQGNLLYLAERMHPAVVDALGGKAVVLEGGRRAMTSPLMRDLQFTNVEIGEPVDVASTPARRYVAVPFVAIMVIRGVRIRSVGYQLAIQDAGEAKWWFLEGARLTPEKVSHFFPDFPKTAVLPPVRQEVLER